MQDQESLQTLVRQAVGYSHSFPNRDELQFLEKQPATKSLVNQANRKIIELMNSISKFVVGNQLKTDSLTLPFSSVEQVMDELIERIGTSLDKQDGDDGFIEIKSKVRKQIVLKEEEQLPIKPPDQYGFREALTLNQGTYPFIPIIKNKLYAIEPLHPDIVSAQSDSLNFFNSLKAQGVDVNTFEFSHPYQLEIESLEPSQAMIDPNEAVQSFRPLREHVYVQDRETLQLMVDSILELVQKNGCTEIAVDLEHHHQHSYLGLTSLIQITTREQFDFIVDPFPLWNCLGEVLAPVFHNPAVLKVLHGADSDVQWLQRDFGLYLVNMFDTFNASKALMLPACSFAYLLEYYCHKHTDKRFQLADWTIRPLTEEMKMYAQMDTHFLLYIYDRLRIDLYNLAIQRDLQPTCGFIISSFSKSKDTSLKLYRKPQQNSSLLLDGILLRAQRTLDPNRYHQTIELLSWREKLARENDENSHTLLPNYQLFKIVELKPTKLIEIYGATGGERSTHPLIKKNYNEITRLFMAQQLQEANSNSNNPGPIFQKIIDEDVVDQVVVDGIKSSLQFNQSNDCQYDYNPMDVKLRQYEAVEKTIINNENMSQRCSCTKLKQDFHFDSPYEFFKDSEIVQQILNGAAQDVNQEEQVRMIDNQDDFKLQKAITDDYIAFTAEKGEKFYLIIGLYNRPQTKQTQYKLFNEQPQSLQEQYGGIRVNSRKRKARNTEDQSVIKQSQKKNYNNIFEKLSS